MKLILLTTEMPFQLLVRLMLQCASAIKLPDEMNFIDH